MNTEKQRSFLTWLLSLVKSHSTPETLTLHSSTTSCQAKFQAFCRIWAESHENKTPTEHHKSLGQSVKHVDEAAPQHCMCTCNVSLLLVNATFELGGKTCECVGQSILSSGTPDRRSFTSAWRATSRWGASGRGLRCSCVWNTESLLCGWRWALSPVAAARAGRTCRRPPGSTWGSTRTAPRWLAPGCSPQSYGCPGWQRLRKWQEIVMKCEDAFIQTAMLCRSLLVCLCLWVYKLKIISNKPYMLISVSVSCLFFTVDL